MSEKDQFSISDLPLAGLEEYVACRAWEYDTSFWQRTIIMDFDLVCDVSRSGSQAQKVETDCCNQRYGLRKLQQQLTFLGLMCGVFLSGLISDRFGRRRTMLALLLTTILVGTLSSFSPNYPAFLVGN